MRVDAISASGPSVTGAIRQAAQITGANFQYLLATAQVESNFNPNAAAPTSSAGGLFQFIEQTWLSTLKQAGSSYGYGKYADAISRTGSGRYVVADPSMRAAVMRLRNDPTANAVMAGVFTQQNAAKLAGQIGRAPNEGELYIAHFLGAAGAAKLITTAGISPNSAAAGLFPLAARANHAIFYDQQGSPRSASQVYSLLVGKYAVAHAGSTSAAPVAVASVPDTAGVANAYEAATVGPRHMATEDGPVFYSLFKVGDRREPIAPVVNQLWTPQAASAPAAPAPSASASSTAGDAVPASQASGQGIATALGLFQTQPADVRGLFRGGV